MTDATKASILLVDDEENLRQTLGDYLAFRGYRVEMAKNGEGALKMLRTFHPDIIILDMAMPGMGGVSFLRKILDDGGQPRYPVLVLTARTMMKDFFDGVSVQGFISKPSSEKKIVREVERILASARKAATDKTATNSQTPGAKKVLLCEDDHRRVHEMVGTFVQAGYDTHVVTTGPEALQTAMSMVPDVIVLKEILTGMNGSKVATLLSAMQATKEIPVVLYDSAARLQDRHVPSQDDGVSVCKKIWTTNPVALCQAVDELFAKEVARP